MISVIGSMLLGILLGYLLRGRNIWFIQPCITFFIWLLLWLLGIEVGSNETIVQGLHTLGLEAVVLTLGGALGSATAAWGLWKMVRRGNKKSTTEADSAESEAAKGSAWAILKSSLVIVMFFAVGIGCGLMRLLPIDVHETGISFYALYALMISVGMSMGSDPQMLRSFRSLSPRMAVLPLFTIVGTLSGVLITGLLLGQRPLTDYLAVGSGFGYYSLSSILITEYRGAELGTVALLANICRELLTMLGAPLLLRSFGRLAPISIGGATSMDSTLPIITRACGKPYAVLSIFHGFCVDSSVPFLVALFCSF